jgi:ankyrin repeat protein
MTYAEFRPSGTFVRLGFCVAALLSLSGAVLGQQPPSLANKVEIVPSKIEYIPPLTKAVLRRDPEQVSKLLEAPGNVDERVRAKDGAPAGFTPLIVAASLSDAKIAQMLVLRGAKVTEFDDFHRSAFWYAALNQSLGVTTVLVGAPGAKDAVNAADNDLKRTPLHIAVHGNSPEIVGLLLKVGASREQKDLLGETPDDYCKERSTEACEALR